MAEKKENFNVITEGNLRILKIDYEDQSQVPSLENNAFCMSASAAST